MSNFIKTRATPMGNRSFAGQAKQNQQRFGRRTFEKIEGQYNNFYPREIPLWIALCPTQSWEFDIYDREEQEVVHKTDQFCYAYREHRIASTSRRFNCSSTAHKNKPCWGCGVQNYHWDRMRALKERTGVKSSQEAPINGALNYALSVVVLELMAKIPAVDKVTGRPKLNKSNEPIINETPLPLLDIKVRDKLKKDGAVNFGWKGHWSYGTTVYNWLATQDEALANVCASCAHDLSATVFTCPDCLEDVQVAEEDDPLRGVDLGQMRNETFTCSACDYEGPMTPVVQCECGSPVEGGIANLALRVKSTKVGDSSRTYEIVEVKPLSHFFKKNPVTEELLKEPLNLPGIFAPTSLEFQKKLVPQELRGDGVTPDPRSGEESTSPTTPYTFGGSDGDSETTEDDIPY